MHKERDLNSLVREVLQMAKQQGASAVEVDASINDGFNVNVRAGEVDSVEYENQRDINVTVYMGLRKGSSSTTEIDKEALFKAVEAACNMAKFTGEDPYAGLADDSLMAVNFPDLSLYHPWKLTPEQAIEMALACEAHAYKQDKRIVNSDGVTVSTGSTKYVYGNSHDFVAEMEVTRHDVSCSLIAKEKQSMERDYYYSVARDSKDLDSIEMIAEEAAKRTVGSLGARKISTCKVPVIFSPEIARGLLGHFVSAISGGNLYRKSSFLLNKIGQPVFSSWVHLHENPYLLKALGSASFDSDGLATRQQSFVVDGVLQQYCLGHYSAKRLGLASTANADGVHNLLVDVQTISQSELIKKMDRGLLVTEVMGQGVSILTGDYSRGARGYWVEHGEIQYPVSEITIAGNLADMYRHMVAISNDVDRRGNIHTGSILLEQMTVAGS